MPTPGSEALRRLSVSLALSIPLTAAAQTAATTPDPAFTFDPPPCQGNVFLDVNCSGQFDAWIEQYARDAITGGCGGGNYCPNNSVTRGQMAVFVEKAMRGSSAWPPNTVLVHEVLAADGSPDTVASGQALRDAIAGIPTTGPGAPSAVSPWLVLIGPGVYDLGGESLRLVNWVTLEGRGHAPSLGDPALTSIRGFDTPGSTGTLDAPTVRTELRNLEVVNGTSGGTASVALSVTGTPTVVLRGVTLRAEAGTDTTAALYVTGASTVRVEDALLTGLSGTGFLSAVLSTGGASLQLARVAAYATGAGSPRFGISATDGSLSLIQSLVYVADSTTPSTGVGMDGTSGSIIRSNIFVACNGAAGSANGVSLGNGIAIDILDTVVNSSGASGCPATAVNNLGASFRVFRSDLQSTRYAIANAGAPAASIFVHQSNLRGDVNVVSNGANFSTFIGASQVNGPVLSAGLTCVASYDGNFNAVGANCQ